MYMRLHKAFKLSHHHHTGKKLAHHHTSYGVLLVLLLAVGITLTLGTRQVSADIAQSGNISLGGVMPGPPPSAAAIIENPTDGLMTDQSVITVDGTCPDDVTVQLFKNAIFAGAVPCENGRFSIQISLLSGKNELVAKVVDLINQYGPDSSPVIVYYNPPSVIPGEGGASPSSGQGVNQLILTSDTPTGGVVNGGLYALHLLISGGQAPYALSVDWGDSSEIELVAKSSEGGFVLKHAYKNPGKYIIKVQLTDKSRTKTILQLVVIVHGSAGGSLAVPAITAPEIPTYVPPSFVIIWPLYLLIVLLVLMFWLGERYEIVKLKKQHRLKRVLHS